MDVAQGQGHKGPIKASTMKVSSPRHWVLPEHINLRYQAGSERRSGPLRGRYRRAAKEHQACSRIIFALSPFRYALIVSTTPHKS